ncbi:MAG: helix-turn-helix domain-containing protein [Hyphomicrobiales bacterium]
MLHNSERAAMTVKEFLDWARISRTTFYKEVNNGRIPIRKVGKRTLVTMADANNWLANLETISNSDTAPNAGRLSNTPNI